MRCRDLVHRIFILGLLAGASACVSWQRIEIANPAPSKTAAYQVWSGDSVYVVQQLRIDHDTLSGIRAELGRPDHPGIALSRTVVDSIRLERNATVPVFILGLATALMLLSWLGSRLYGN